MRIAKQDISRKELSKQIIFNPIVKHQLNISSELLRIELTEDFTRIDFIYYPKPNYVNGGWVQIAGDTFIQPTSGNERLSLVKVENITIAPVKHYFKSIKENLCYTLYFPPVPKNTLEIDIIESTLLDKGTWLNFYGVSLMNTQQKRLIVNNKN